MREILFKAKQIDTGEWVEGFPYWGEYAGAFILQNKTVKKRNARTGEIKLSDGAVPVPVDGSTVCQYTGLADKNGVKIFESDILVHRYTSANGAARQKEYIVQWADNGFHLFDDDYGFNPKNMEVIGNIHD